MEVAYWSPLPPDPSGIADFSYDLLAALNGSLHLTAIVRDELAGREAPPGVGVITAAEYRPERFDQDIYHLGNHAPLHHYVYRQATSRPGLLVLHDPSLVDFYSGMLGGYQSSVFEEEARYSLADDGPIPYLMTEHGREPDRLAILMSRRLVEASARTLVHSRGVRDEMRERWPGVRVEYLPLATPLLPLSHRTENAPATFGIFGGISWHKRIPVGVRAFLEARAEYPEIRLIIAGRRDEPQLAEELRALAASEEAGGAVECHFDVELERLETLIQSTDAVIAQRWPTAGETSALLMRSFGAGRAAIVSDVLQYREFAGEYCTLVPVGVPDEVSALRARIVEVARDPARARLAGGLARSFVEEQAAPDKVATGYLLHLREIAESYPDASRDPRLEGVNAIASWASTTGLTEAARRGALALLDSGVELAIEDYDFGSPRDPGRFPRRFEALRRGRPFPIDLCFVNVNELQVMPEDYLQVPGHYVIGSWFWELPSIPLNIERQLRRVDEIWVASEFVRDAFAQYTPAHIEVLPCVVEPVPTPDATRETFGLPEDRCTFLFAFDANSTFARKNPQGVIEAYRKAFSPSERREVVHLVVKTINLQGLDEGRDLLTNEIESVGATLIDDEFTAGDVAALVASCDVFISLHRAEGFGLGLAEAMYFGRPVIATAYSGNVDFTSPANSCEVGYELRPIEVGALRFNPFAEYIYEPGSLWAEPDVEQAARWMRLLYEHADLRQRIGKAGQATVRQRLSSAAVGRAMRRRLMAVSRRLAGSP